MGVYNYKMVLTPAKVKLLHEYLVELAQENTLSCLAVVTTSQPTNINFEVPGELLAK